MDSGSWTRLSTTTTTKPRYQSRSDLYLGGGFGGGGVDEMDGGDDDSKVEYICPFCAEDFDIVGLCCHIDEDHPVEAKNGVCPVCAKRVGMDMVGHVTTQHGSFFKVQRKRRFRKGGSNSTFSILRKELREGNLQSLFGGSSGKVPSSNIEADPLLSSFMSNIALADEPVSVQSHHSVEPSSIKKSTDDNSLPERNGQQPPLSGKDQEEKARKCEFVQGLLLSTILDDVL